MTDEQRYDLALYLLRRWLLVMLGAVMVRAVFGGRSCC